MLLKRVSLRLSGRHVRRHRLRRLHRPEGREPDAGRAEPGRQAAPGGKRPPRSWRRAKPEPAKQPPAPKRVKSEQGIIVEGLDNCLVKFSKCCTPVPGDDIIGFITRGYGVSVHRCGLSQRLGGEAIPAGAGGPLDQGLLGATPTRNLPIFFVVGGKGRSGLFLSLLSSPLPRLLCVGGTPSVRREDVCHLPAGGRVKDGAQLKSVMNKLNQISGVLKVNRPAG